MQAFEEEPDYLVRTQLAVNPFSFREVVKEAFLLEHQCQQNQDIAKVLGVDKSRVSQILNSPKNLKPETVQMLIKALKNIDQKRRIVRAWAFTCFGRDIYPRRETALTGDLITEKILRRVSRYMRESRFETAATVALEAAEKTNDWILREQFLDRAHLAFKKVDELGQAMRVVRMVIEGAAKRQEPLRAAIGHMWRARILLRTNDIGPSDVEPIFAEIERLVASTEYPTRPPPYVIMDEESIEKQRITAAVYLMEHGRLPLDSTYLRAKIAVLQKPSKGKRPYQFVYSDHLLMSSMHLLLGETFAAEEHLDAAFKSGGIKNVSAYEACAMQKGRILRMSEPADIACQHFQELSSVFERRHDPYHHRLAEYAWAKLESDRCSEFLQNRW